MSAALDIRMPIGFMFAVIGGLLVAYGLFSERTIYQRSLGINLNLWWGIGLLVFAAVMIRLAHRARRRI
jgi:hypothetical protein